MATQTIALSTPLAGLATPTLRVFPEATDIQVSGSPFTLVEATNCKGRYTVTFTGTLDGRHKVVLYNGSDVLGCGWVDLVNATGTYEVRSEYAGAAEMRSALGMAAADLDAQLDSIIELIEADREIDTTTTPWEEVVKIRGTSTELLRRKLRDTAGQSVTATSQVIGSAKES